MTHLALLAGVAEVRQLPSYGGSVARWWYALKPASWPKLLVPAALGQALAVASTGTVSLAGLALGALFTLLDLIFIVLLNDWGDREVDAIKRRMFPDGCSPKTIPDGILPASWLLVGGVGAGVLAWLVAIAGSYLLGLPVLAFLGLGALLVFVAYSFPPLALNYRGGGEILEMVGVGLVLPWINALFQSGQLLLPAPTVLVSFTLLSLASAIASGLSDEESDRAGGKHTFTTTFGNPAMRRAVEALTLLGAMGFGLAAATDRGLIPAWGAAAAILVMGGNFFSLRGVSDTAVTNAFRAQGTYKRSLHRAIWGGTTVLALSAVANRFLET